MQVPRRTPLSLSLGSLIWPIQSRYMKTKIPYIILLLIFLVIYPAISEVIPTEDKFSIEGHFRF